MVLVSLYLLLITITMYTNSSPLIFIFWISSGCICVWFHRADTIHLALMTMVIIHPVYGDLSLKLLVIRSQNRRRFVFFLLHLSSAILSIWWFSHPHSTKRATVKCSWYSSSFFFFFILSSVVGCKTPFHSYHKVGSQSTTDLVLC